MSFNSSCSSSADTKPGITARLRLSSRAELLHSIKRGSPALTDDVVSGTDLEQYFCRLFDASKFLRPGIQQCW